MYKINLHNNNCMYDNILIYIIQIKLNFEVASLTSFACFGLLLIA